eukprot:3946368-Prymnesium_polylepis.1
MSPHVGCAVSLSSIASSAWKVDCHIRESFTPAYAARPTQTGGPSATWTQKPGPPGVRARGAT